MRLLIALLLPWLAFFTIGRPLSGIVCTVLQVTLIGWVPAAIWSRLRGQPVPHRPEDQARAENRRVPLIPSRLSPGFPA